MENLKALERQQTKVSLKHITNEIYEIFFKEYKGWIGSRYGVDGPRVIKSLYDIKKEKVETYIIVERGTYSITIIWGNCKLKVDQNNKFISPFNFTFHREDGPAAITYVVGNKTDYKYWLKGASIYDSVFEEEYVVLDSENLVGVFEKQKRLGVNGVRDIISFNKEAATTAEKEFEDFVHSIERKI